MGLTAHMQVFLAEPIVVDELRTRVNLRLDALIPAAAGRPDRVNQAVRYALLAPGKRIRPLLTLLTAIEFGADAAAALDVACAAEMVHTASLVLDDLPSMDDAQLRRGQPTVHIRFGESTAILAAIALMNQAYATIARSGCLSPKTRLDLVGRLADAIGFDGLVTGQANDLNDRDKTITMSGLEILNHQKTSVLFEAALEMGARVAGVGGGPVAALRRVAAHLGLAYQIADDLFDCVPGNLALPALKDVDQDRGKSTMVSLLGVEQARERVAVHLEEALRLLPLRADGVQVLRHYIMLTFGHVRLC